MYWYWIHLSFSISPSLLIITKTFSTQKSNSKKIKQFFLGHFSSPSKHPSINVLIYHIYTPINITHMWHGAIGGMTDRQINKMSSATIRENWNTCSMKTRKRRFWEMWIYEWGAIIGQPDEQDFCWGEMKRSVLICMKGWSVSILIRMKRMEFLWLV